MAFPNDVLSIATSQNWIAVGLHLFLSTIIGGIVLIVLLGIASRAWGESVKVENAFLMVLIVQVITVFGILGFVAPYLPIGGPVLTFLVWLGFTKAFFSQLKWIHALVIGVIGFALTFFVVPTLTSIALGFIPV
ncbi:MAG: hypothetical protein HY369_02580 [Candidatus Aenigmarchaeota archaeon]|nr:hypothetical protein [Candidatus Aenigmarchaeota archaeon]